MPQNTTSGHKLPHVSRFLQWPSSSKCVKNGVKASVNRDSLDHLQKATKTQQPQQQFKKRAPQVTPIGTSSKSFLSFE